MFYSVKVGTVTNAQRAKYALAEKGIKSTVSRLKHPKKGDGCGYVIQVTCEDIDRVIAIIERENIKIRGVDVNDLL